jgi:ADP-heptose:LPS heptosyltransferase
LKVPIDAREAARKLLAREGRDGRSSAGPRIGIQVGSGRQVKQWDPARFGELGAALALKHGATLVFTGSAEDRPLVDLALARLPKGTDAIDLCGRVDLLTLAAVLERLSVFVTGDTGPMHLAAAVGTPLVAIFGPSDPRRWGPLSSGAQIVHSAVACRPCNRIRRPPSHCVGRIPECLASIGVGDVLQAVEQVLARTGDAPAATAPAVPRERAAEAADGSR